MSALNWKYTPKTKDLPATQGIVHLVRNELKENILEIKSELKKMNGKFSQVDGKFAQVDARFEQVDARFEQVDARFEQVDARFEQVDARFDQVDAKFVQVDARFDQVDAKIDSLKHELKGEISRLSVLVEEQNARNAIVLEGLSGLFSRQERVEKRMDNVETAVGTLGFPRK